MEDTISMDNPDIKIFISYHKESATIQNKYIIPIHVGAKNSKQILNMQRDDEGINISEKNPLYCELTAQYWAWKNSNADYFGFMHYRRHFIFNQESVLKTKGEIKHSKTIDKKYINDCGLVPDKIKNIVKHYDIIVPLIEKIVPDGNVFEHYAFYTEQHKEDYLLMLEVIKDLYPEYYQSALEYSKSEYGYFCNMFIMKKEYFYTYSEWLFNILFEIERRKDYSDYSMREYRVLAYLAERLLGIYVFYIKKNSQIHILELQHTFVENVENKKMLKPAFEINNNLIFMSSDNYYTPYVATLIYSIIYNSTDNYNYDLVILTQNISAKNQNKIKSMANNYKNISIRFFDVSEMVKGKSFNTDAYALETYYRLFAPEVFINYNSGLYLDSDMVVNDNIAKLFEYDIENYYLAAVRDYDEMGHVRKKGDDWDEYLREYVGIKDVYSPFQGGVLLMNFQKFRDECPTSKMVQIATQKKYRIADQDVLNLCCEGHIFYINPAWDIMVDNENKQDDIFSYSPRTYYQEYLDALSSPKIIHFCGWPKPWTDLESDMAEYFWKYAQRTPFYEIILERIWNSKLDDLYISLEKNKDSENGKGICIKGIKDPIYANGVTVKFINHMNKRFPLGSRKREYLKKILNKLF